MMQQQQPGHMFPVMPSFPATNITTDQIQKYLDENKKLILAILENQNIGKLAECAQYQAQLQKNLMYLAAIADAQPQTPAMPPQMTPHPATQQGGFYMQHPQAAAMAQQPGLFPQRPLFNSPQPMQDPQQHLPHPQATQAQMVLRPLGPTNSVNVTLNNTNLGGNKQDKTDGGATTGSDGHGNSGVARGGRDGEEAK